jgi:hypothetical protein
MLIPINELEDINTMANTFKSRRLKILKALEAILNTIKIENGYTNSVNLVTFDSKSWRDMAAPQTPTIFIIDDIVQITRFAGKTREYIWTIRLFGVVKEFTLEEFEEHIADVEECIEDNNHLAGIVNKCEIQNVITDNQLFENTNNRLYEMELRVEFIRCLGNPK